MKQINVYEVYADNVLKLSTVNEDEAFEYMKMYYEAYDVRCEMQTILHVPMDHTKE